MKSSVQFLQGVYHYGKHYLGGNVDRYSEVSLLPIPELVSFITMRHFYINHYNILVSKEQIAQL